MRTLQEKETSFQPVAFDVMHEDKIKKIFHI